MGSAGFLDPFNWVVLAITVALTCTIVVMSWDASRSEAMYLHGVLNVVAFAMMVAIGISKQIALVMKWKKNPDEYMTQHKQRHTFVNALAMVPAYAALYIGQRARSQPGDLSIANQVLAVLLVALVALNFGFCVANISSNHRWATYLAWTTGAVSAASTALLIADGPPPEVTHHYLGITAIFMYQAILLRFFVSYGFEKDDMKSAKMTHFREGRTLYGLGWLVASPVAYIGDGMRMLRGWENARPTPSKTKAKVGKYLDHIIWGFGTLGVALGAIFTGISLYTDWYLLDDHGTHLYALAWAGLGAFILIPLSSF